MKALLYYSVGADVMSTSILWTEVGFHNGAKGTVEDFVYTDYEIPIKCGVPEAAVVQL